ncbi:MAG: 8-amino-7-oxononanoate synthase [Gammaproteobacteria bacterium]|nr:8-amino-7-oxononanoate synthase [Gammaproteobacteria bacterium]
MKSLKDQLQQKKKAGLYRQRRVTEGPQAAEIVIDGKKVINFCSNNYLGLANHPDINAAFKKGIDSYGSGSGAAHLINGHSAAHHALEEELAEFTGYQRCLLFSTGYMANLGIAQALMGRGDVVLEDRLNHASLLDAGLLSGARFSRFAHADVSDAEKHLSKYPDKEKMLLTDGVFSMDGDIAPLPALAKACQQHDSYLMVDDAHGIGVLGEKGRGCIEHFDLGPSDVPILMGTLGKAFGTAGAFVAADDDVIETLIQNARSYIYTTASPPALAEATRASLKLLQSENWRREHLAQLIKQFRQSVTEMGYELMDSVTPIQPILIGDSQLAMKLSQKLFDLGIHIGAIRPPTVEEGTARLRVTLSAAHSFEQLKMLLHALDALRK